MTTKRDQAAVLFDHIRLDVKDIERSSSFYAEVLGLATVVRYVIPGGVIMQMGAYGRPPGVELWMEAGNDVRPHATHHVAFLAHDVPAVVARARSLAATIEREPFRIGDETVAFLRDPDGHLVELNDFRGR